MKTFLLYLFPLLLVLGGALFGWLARWYRYGGRCGKDGLAAGVPNVDIVRGTVALDGSEPAMANMDDARQAVGTLRAGYADGMRGDASARDTADGSTVGKIGAMAGGAAAAIGAGVASASGSVRDAASGLKDAATSATDGSRTDGSGEDASGGSTMSKLSSAVSDAASTVKEKASGAVESAKSSIDSVRERTGADGDQSGATSATGGTGDSTMSKLTSAVTGAVSTVKDKASGAVESAKSSIETAKERVSADSDLPGATIGQEQGHSHGTDGLVAGHDADDDMEVDVPSALSTEELEAQRLIDSGETVAKPASALATPQQGREADDLQRIKGIGPKIETTLNGEGIYYFDQIAGFGGRDIAWADKTLAVKGRVVRDRWVPQAQGLAALNAEVSEVDVPASLSNEEQEAQRLIDSGAEVAKPVSALSAPRSDRSPDDLKRIKGIGPKIERTLNGEGIYYFDQIADFGGRDIAWADRTLAVKGRVVRDRWVPQARGLADLGPQDNAAMRARFASLSEEAADDAAQGTGMDAGMIDIPEGLSDAELEAQRLIDSGEEVGKPVSALSAPESGRAPDDLKLISGIGPKIEDTLNGEGVYYFDQIANFGGRDLAWADRTLGFRGRVVRDRWIPQARGLADRPGRSGPGASADAADAGADATTSAPLRLAEAEALRMIEQEGGYVATEANRPAMLMLNGPVSGTPDDLQQIKGIGAKLESMLHGMGIYYFRQVASFTASDIAWVDSKLQFKGRIIRDRWVPQAESFEKNRNA